MPGLVPGVPADLARSLTRIDAWRPRVVERRWSPEAFRDSRPSLVAALLTAPWQERGLHANKMRSS
jgi:hypothetical protein